MLLAVLDGNECNFGIMFKNESKLDEIKKLAKAGLGAWYQAANDDYENEYFTADEIEGFYNSGYAEPTEELLEKFNIEAEIVDLDFNSNDEAICDAVVWY